MRLLRPADPARRALSAWGRRVLRKAQDRAREASFSTRRDRSWTSILRSLETSGECGAPYFVDRFRIRSDGTFIIYIGKTIDESDNRMSADVLEGNWEPKGDQIRIFGKKYSTDIVSSEYLNETHAKKPAIFQSLMTVKRYRAMTPEEKRNILATTTAVYNDEWTVDLSTDQAKNRVEAKGRDAFIAKAEKILNGVNPYFVESPAFSALLLPTDEVNNSGSGCE